MKICGSCKVEKPFSEFYKDKSKPDGLYLRCKACHNVSTAKYAKTHKEDRARQAREWRERNPKRAKEVARRAASKSYAENPEKWKVRAKKWYGANRDRALEYHKIRRAEKADHIKAVLADYYLRNAEKIKARIRQNEILNRERDRPINSARAMARIAKRKTQRQDGPISVRSRCFTWKPPNSQRQPASSITSIISSRCKASGFVAFIAKPIFRSSLRRSTNQKAIGSGPTVQPPPMNRGFDGHPCDTLHLRRCCHVQTDHAGRP